MNRRKSRIAVLMAVHNRRDHTVRAIRALLANQNDFDLSLVLLDDDSADGTREAVLSEWPSAIVLPGDGNAFWNGGMHQAWTHALRLGFDGYLWLNDDVILDSDAINRLSRAWFDRGGADLPFILVGPTRDDRGELSYGGQKFVFHPLALKFKKIPISNEFSRADTFNGNIVLITQAIVKMIGINDPKFFHALGDIDYGLRASRAGLPVLVLPGTLGVCNGNPPVTEYSGSLRSRLKTLRSHRGLPVGNWWRITRRYSGIWLPLHFLLPYRKLLRSSKSRSSESKL